MPIVVWDHVLMNFTLSPLIICKFCFHSTPIQNSHIFPTTLAQATLPNTAQILESNRSNGLDISINWANISDSTYEHECERFPSPWHPSVGKKKRKVGKCRPKRHGRFSRQLKRHLHATPKTHTLYRNMSSFHIHACVYEHIIYMYILYIRASIETRTNAYSLRQWGSHNYLKAANAYVSHFRESRVRNPQWRKILISAFCRRHNNTRDPRAWISRFPPQLFGGVESFICHRPVNRVAKMCGRTNYPHTHTYILYKHTYSMCMYTYCRNSRQLMLVQKYLHRHWKLNIGR